jgi:23S rRNA (guanosine2251-2'-O)-methyltransferase
MTMTLICGINPVFEALQAGTRQFDRLVIAKGVRNRRVSELIARAGQLGVPLRFEVRETMDRLSDGVPHQGVIAVASAKALVGLEDLLEQVREPGLLVVLDGVEDPRNLGAILRSVDAAGADGVLLPERHSAGLSETVARTSAGGLEHVRLARIGNVSQAIERLKERGFWVVGLDATGGQRWDEVDLRRPVALVLGGEGRGIRRLVRERCDQIATIPLFGHVSSLNVAVAAAVALFEAVRQRGSVPSVVKPIPQRAASAPRVIGPDGEIEAPPVEAAEEEQGPGPLYHDEPGWSAGPTLIEPRRKQKLRRGGPGRDRPQRAERSPAPQAGAPPAGEAPRSSDATRGGEGRRRKRRRRRGPGGPAETASPGQAAPRPAAAPAPAGSSPEAGNRIDPRRRGRRRRRARPQPQ